MDRAPVFETVGCRFEPCQARLKAGVPWGCRPVSAGSPDFFFGPRLAGRHRRCHVLEGTMIYAHQGRSIPQKTLLVGIQTLLLGVTGWLLLGNGLATLNRWFGWNLATGDETRRILLFACAAVVWARILFTQLYLLKRAIGWEEAASIPLAFMLYYLGFSLLGGTRAIPVDGLDGLAVALFVGGSFLNTYSEILRDIWRKRPENRVRLYTGGLFRYARHINYFGDLVWVSGYALLTRNPWSALIPVLLFLFFYLYNAPQLDQHLRQKYPEAFAAYEKRTKMLIPFVL
jgi:protein-S-isoprenylcysteine O-methyltransferase Ste14